MRTGLENKRPIGKRTRHVGSQGFTAIEMVGAVALAVILVGAGLPVMMTSVGSARVSGAGNANRYRVEGRRTPAISWPAEADTPQQTADLFVGAWINLAASYPGIQLDNSGTGSNPPFYAGFDSSGKMCMPLTQCFDGVSPLVITKDSTGQTRQISSGPA